MLKGVLSLEQALRILYFLSPTYYLAKNFIKERLDYFLLVWATASSPIPKLLWDGGGKACTWLGALPKTRIRFLCLRPGGDKSGLSQRVGAISDHLTYLHNVSSLL
jgi:hypothetical protein